MTCTWTINKDRSPIILSAFFADDCVVEEFAEYMDEADAVSRDFARRYIFLSFAQIKHMGASARKLAADRFKANSDFYGEYCIATINVLENRIQRGFFTAILWMFKPPIPVYMVATRRDAYQLAKEYLSAEGLSCPDLPEAFFEEKYPEITRTIP